MWTAKLKKEARPEGSSRSVFERLENDCWVLEGADRHSGIPSTPGSWGLLFFVFVFPLLLCFSFHADARRKYFILKYMHFFSLLNLKCYIGFDL